MSKSNQGINWLEDWLNPIDFENLNARGIARKQELVEIFVRGHLHKEGQRRGNHHSIVFVWTKVSDDPKAYTLEAYLDPPPIRRGSGGPGSNLVPSPPPQPPPPPIAP